MSLRPITQRRLPFTAAALRGYEWHVSEIAGDGPGPRLCVMAGMHVNEVAGIAAARDLIRHFAGTAFQGTVSILPLTDPAAFPYRAQTTSPADGRNINFSFPGDCAASYSPALACGLLQDWAGDADVLIDLHGGDLCECVTPFAVTQRCPADALDAQNLALAEAFDPEVIVQLAPDALAHPGRSCTGRAVQGRAAAFFEAGANGLLDDASIRQHVDGVRRVAALLGMVEQAPPLRRAPAPRATQYHWLSAGQAGWCHYLVEAGARVDAGMPLARLEVLAGGESQLVLAPAAGIILWRCTHPLVVAETALFGLAAALVPPQPRADAVAVLQPDVVP